MTSVPVTFEELQDFIQEQERILTKEIKYDDKFRNALKGTKIKVKEEEMEAILNKVNIIMKRKYKSIFFTRQSRFQTIQQIIQLERENRQDKANSMKDINKLLKIFEQRVDGALVQDPLNGRLFELISELPDSNFLETNSVEIIDEYDSIRERLQSNTEKIVQLQKANEEIDFLNENVRSLLDHSLANRETEQEDNIDQNIDSEIEKMRHLLSLAKHN
ncbi:hypothetical protein CAS74_001179 [Pichia kudriavzevii]|uniref:Uncharacterized protein n=1 Tax=Pichia kudriavzevii TaxID=4909 RepID=A0A099P348_PICKU|nr:uncharacterized protein C5L36_0C11600 [Pichia kudriavzevii]AWU77254.1 hypothetical protein C5L36_0C11600 [Pichia kudriavzevii]KGK38652.1 hypothetical protein JL09_g2164 [Pichia kudriavzevii]OUT24788.1 hypothetical protein CAS74_001179 [Pichia kudriavzevii]